MLGRESRDQIVSMLPEGWIFEGKRVLDFGCGAGRTLRHFLQEAETAEFWGCDIDDRSIGWLREHLSPPLHAFKNPPSPPIPRPNGYFDLVYAISVFTHLTDSWAEWLQELHRLLIDGGLLIATYMGEGMSERLLDEPWEEDRVGMNVVRSWQSWDEGGPWAFHSDWWIAAHWGRAFEILDVVHRPGMGGELGRHSWALLQKKPGKFTPSDLERLEPGEEREIEALRNNLRQLHADAAKAVAVRDADADELRRQLDETSQRLDHAQQRLASTIEGYEGSASWRITKPLRAIRRRHGGPS
jgi:SAM-dependent methyltransferase